MFQPAPLPPDLPVPQDDGACNHLTGLSFPEIVLESTAGPLCLARLPGTTVIYIYPRSSPDALDVPGWDAIPGARGCSPQGCAFRDHEAELQALGAQVFGLATQHVPYLKSEVERLHLPFPLVSDAALMLQGALGLPVFEMEIDGMKLLKRVTLILRGGRIVKVFYPVFPPDRNAGEVIAWLRENPA